MLLDITGTDAQNLLYIENLFKALMEKYNYQYIRTPHTEDEQLINLIQNNQDLETNFRTDGLIGVIRTYINKTIDEDLKPVKIWNSGSIYDLENNKESYILRMDTLGCYSPTIDLEVINAAVNLYKLLGLDNFILKINTNGDVDHFNKIKSYLTEMEIEYVVDETLILSKNYYSDFIFEIINKTPESDLVIGIGGRYNNLINEVSGIDVPGIGFEINLNNLLTVLKYDGFIMNEDEGIDVFIGVNNEEYIPYGLKLVETLRMNAFNVEFNHNNIEVDNIKDAKFIIIIDEQVINEEIITIIDVDTKEKLKIDEEYIINLLDEKVSGANEKNIY